MATIDQSPAQLNLVGVGGNPFTLKVTATFKAGTVAIPWATITAAQVHTVSGGSTFTSMQPVLTTPSAGVWQVAWSATAMTAIRTAGGCRWYLEATVQGSGPLTLMAGQIRALPPQTPGASSPASATLAVKVGTATATLVVTVGGASAVSSVNGKTGVVVLHAATVTALPTAGGTMTGPIVGFEDKGGQVFNVKAYGAKGNGGTDDTAAIQAAITAAGATSAGGIIFFPPGTYPISKTITLPHSVYSGGATTPQTAPIFLLGSGYMLDGYYTTHPFGTILLAKTLAGDMIQGPSTNNVGTHFAIEKMTIWGNEAPGSQSSGHLVHIYNPMESWFRDVIIRYAHTNGLRIDGAGVAGNLVTIDHCRIEHCGGNGCSISGTVQNMVLASHFEANGGTAGLIVSVAASQTVIVGCSFQSNTKFGVVPGNECKVIGCHAETNGHSGFMLTGSRNTSVVGCTAISNGTSGVDTQGIRLWDAMYCYVAGNMCLNTGDTTPQKYGIALQGTSTTNVVVGNRVSAQTAPITVATGKNVVKDNIGYNPVGLVTVAVPTSGTAVAVAPYDRTFYITASTSTVACAVTDAGGTSQTVATIPSGGFAGVFVPAGSTLTPTYTAAPTWTVQGH